MKSFTTLRWAALGGLVLLALPVLAQTQNYIRLPLDVATAETVSAATSVSGAALMPSQLLLDFGKQQVYTNSAARTVRVTNKGTQPATVVAVSLSSNQVHFSGDFADCEAPLEPGQGCDLTLVFSPRALGTFSTRVIAELEDGSTQTLLTAQGTGVQGQPRFDASGLRFDGVKVGQLSAAKTLSLTNVGTGDLTIGSLTLTGDSAFQMTSACPPVLAVEATCTLSLGVLPPDALIRSATVTLNAPGALPSLTRVQVTTSPAQLVVLDASGTSALDALSVPSTAAGTLSPAASFVVKNMSSTAAPVPSISVASPFLIFGNTCPSSLPANGQCVVSVQAQPSAERGYSSAVSFSGSSGLALPLTHTATGTQLVLSTYNVDFGQALLGASVPSQAVLVLNQGTQAVALGSVSVSGDFDAVSNCGASLAAGSSCQLSLSFVPSAEGARVGQVTLDTAAGPQLVQLSGTALMTKLDVNPGSLDFGVQKVGQTTGARSVTLTNPGATSLTLRGLNVTGPFNALSNCPAALAANSSCTLSVFFTPASSGLLAGTLSVQSDAYAAPVKTVALSGTGAMSLFELSSSSLAFGAQTVGVPGNAQTLVLTNTGLVSLGLTAPTLTGPFSVSTNCATVLQAGASCYYNVTFVPTASGTVSGVLGLNTEAGQQTVSLTGTGQQAVAALSTAALDFASQGVNTSSPVQSVAVLNNGDATLTLSAIATTGPFTASQSCSALPVQVAPGNACAISVIFSPTSTGLASGTLSVTTSTGVQTVALTGTGVQVITTAFALSFDSSLNRATDQVSGATLQGAPLLVDNALIMPRPGIVGDGSTLPLQVRQNTGFAAYQDFTLEAWIAPTKTSGRVPVITSSDGRGVNLWYDITNKRLDFNAGGISWPTANVNLPVSSWSHVAVVRNGQSLKTYVNGSEVASWTGTADKSSNGYANAVMVGQWAGWYEASYASIGSVRLSLGARYLAPFAPQGQPTGSPDPANVIGMSTSGDSYGRTWADASMAASCYDYRYPAAPKRYAGAVGSGVYRIKPPGLSEMVVYCEMVTDGGGWTLVLQGGNQPYPGYYPLPSWNNSGDILSTELLRSSAFSKYSDTVIRALAPHGYRLTGNVQGYGSFTRFVSPACVYNHTAMATGACTTTYANPEFTQGAVTGMNGGAGQPGLNGIADLSNITGSYIVTNIDAGSISMSSTQNPDGSITITYTPSTSDYRFLVENGVRGAFRIGGYDNNYSNFRMWVR